jgi:hypothetical protein
MAVATSGIPPKHTLWRTNVCSPHYGLSRALDGSKVEDEEESPPEVRAPVSAATAAPAAALALMVVLLIAVFSWVVLMCRITIYA